MQTSPHFNWTVIGAGPGGIAAIGKLLDSGVLPKQIAWIDPAFKVGDFGSQWHNVSSNTKAGLFTRFLLNCQSFNFDSVTHEFALSQLDPAQTCKLHFMVEPLQWITKKFKSQINCFTGFASKLSLKQRHWQITLENTVLLSKNVILAVGSEPNILNHSFVETIPLTVALDAQRLAASCQPTDTVAVFGSSHSAIMAVRNLLDCSVKQVVNFYRAPLRYAVYFDDWILFDDTGLKGSTAEWARENIDGQLSAKLIRLLSTEENVQQQLKQCNKAVYAIGFSARKQPHIEGFADLTYNHHSGIIAPGLFGLGIAFPEANIDRFGNLEYRVGLWKFMDYLNRIMPVWHKYSC